MNGMILTGPRVYYARARQGVFPRVFGHANVANDRHRTPIAALMVQGVWAGVLAASDSYEQLFIDVIFTAWIFYGPAAGAVLVLRHTAPELKRPFCVLGYPWLSVLFCVAAMGLILSTLIERP